MSEFEWDPDKSLENKKKHQISFKEGLEIWQGMHLTVENLAYSKNGEKRSATIGLIKGHFYTAIWTRRGGKIRLISIRRSRDGEKEAYKKHVF